MIHQNMKAILQFHHQRVQGLSMEIRDTDPRWLLVGRESSWTSLHFGRVLGYVGSRLVLLGKWLEYHSQREYSPSR